MAMAVCEWSDLSHHGTIPRYKWQLPYSEHDGVSGPMCDQNRKLYLYVNLCHIHLMRPSKGQNPWHRGCWKPWNSVCHCVASRKRTNMGFDRWNKKIIQQPWGTQCQQANQPRWENKSSKPNPLG